MLGQTSDTLDPEKIIKVWEGDQWVDDLGKTLTMRACDHRAMAPAYVSEYVYPNNWFEGCAATGKVITIPAEDIMIPAPTKGGQCK